MKVKELIEQLQKVDPEINIVFPYGLNEIHNVHGYSIIYEVIVPIKCGTMNIAYSKIEPTIEEVERYEKSYGDNIICQKVCIIK